MKRIIRCKDCLNWKHGIIAHHCIVFNWCSDEDDGCTFESEDEEAKKVEYNHHCPNCGRGLPAKGLTDEYCSCCFNWKYCPYCGQKLRWE